MFIVLSWATYLTRMNLSSPPLPTGMIVPISWNYCKDEMKQQIQSTKYNR